MYNAHMYPFSKGRERELEGESSATYLDQGKKGMEELQGEPFII